jgi:hypothetical protein
MILTIECKYINPCCARTLPVISQAEALGRQLPPKGHLLFFYEKVFQFFTFCEGAIHLLWSRITPTKKKNETNAVMIYIFYNYVSSNLLDVPLLFSYLLYR